VFPFISTRIVGVPFGIHQYPTDGMDISGSIRNGAWTTCSSAIHRRNPVTSQSCRNLTRSARPFD